MTDFELPLPTKVNIVEVSPRDGFQAEPDFIPTPRKIALINALSKTRVGRIEVTSFVHPKAVPQLADAAEVMQGITRNSGIKYRVLVPNLFGAQRAIENKADEINFVLSASESHNQNNVKKTIKESLKEFEAVVAYLDKNKFFERHVAIGTAFGCPFEGEIPNERVAELIMQLKELGANHIILADTTGMANPIGVMKLLEVLEKFLSISELAVHFHNTRAAGSANVFAALLCGVIIIEGSVGGMGGCPFAPGATGNVATEDIVHMLEKMGVSTGVNLLDLIACAKLASEVLGRDLPGQVMKAGRSCDLHPIAIARFRGREKNDR